MLHHSWDSYITHYYLMYTVRRITPWARHRGLFACSTSIMYDQLCSLSLPFKRLQRNLLLTYYSTDPPIKDPGEEHEASHPCAQHACPPHQLAQQGCRRHGQVARSYQTAGSAVQHQGPGKRQHTQTTAIGHWWVKTKGESINKYVISSTTTGIWHLFHDNWHATDKALSQ